MEDAGSLLELLRPGVHLALHVLLPLGVARVLYPAQWRTAFAWMLAGWLIDVDHLLASPIYVPARCSLGFHPLHTWPAALVYAALLIPARTRPLAVGLLIHLGLDGIDCIWMKGLA
jgi:hypothetical protein